VIPQWSPESAIAMMDSQEKLDTYEDLTASEHTAISHGNAWTLFPRFDPRRHSAP
jgi:hypothetical protein